MESVASSDSSDANIEDFIGLPQGFSFAEDSAHSDPDGDLDEVDHEPATAQFQERSNGNKPSSSASSKGITSGSASSAKPLYSLHEVEVLALTHDRLGLEKLQLDVESRIEDGAEKNGTVQLQRDVLRLAVDIARGEYFNVLQSPLVRPIIAFSKQDSRENTAQAADGNDQLLYSKLHATLHQRVIRFIMDGAPGCGDPSFREPNVMSPDSHVSQRALRALICTFLGSACLGLYLQANWTGPPLPKDLMDEFYPLPFAKVSSSNPNPNPGGSGLDKHMAELEATALAKSAISGKSARVEELDAFPELHLACARMLEANGEPIYVDARVVHYLHTARVVLRCITRPTIVPGCVEPDWALPPLHGQKPQQKPPPENVPGGFRLAVTALVSSEWWCARSAVCHQETLELRGAHSPCLLFEVERCMDKAQAELEKLSMDEAITRLVLERGVFMHKFHEAAKAKTAFHTARERAGLNVTLSGALGKRTKFQESKSQLVLLAASDTTQLDATADKYPPAENGTSSKLSGKGVTVEGDTANKAPSTKNSVGSLPSFKEGESLERDISNISSSTSSVPDESRVLDKDKDHCESKEGSVSSGHAQVKTIRLEEVDRETPLHEEIQFNACETSQEVQMSGRLTSLEQCIVLGLCMDVKNSYAMEGLTAEEMLAYVARVQQHPGNWMVYSTSLLIKSQLEYERMKTKERAVLQMQLLVDQQTDRLTPVQQTQEEIENAAGIEERVQFLQALAWPPLWQLKRELADRFMRLGVAASALEIFQEVRLWEEAVDCLQAMDKRSRAEKLVAERLKVRPTANLYCQMGILKQDPDLFGQAWEFSGQRYARAKRLWGIAMFELGDYPACIGHLQEAVDINPLFPHAWFRLGVAAMRTEQWRTAKNAFIQVTAQEPSQGDAWANLSAVYDKMGDQEAALRAVEQAAKHTRYSWKVWENYLTLSLKQKEWSMAIQAMEQLIDLKVGIGARSKKEGDVDVQALVIIVEGVISSAAVIRQARKQQSDSEENLEVRQRNCDFLRSRLESLFTRIKAECKSIASVWKIMAAYYEAFAQRELLRDALIRRVRALQPDGWERDSTKTKRVVRAVTELAKVYAEDFKENPEKRADLPREVEMLLRATKDKIAAGIDAHEGMSVEDYCGEFQQLAEAMKA